MLNPDSYLVIQSWMVADLKLKGLDLMLYAIIYGFSQDGQSAFSGTLSYLMEWTGCKKRGVLYSLQYLESEGLIQKEEFRFKGVKHCRYRCTPMIDYLARRG